MSYHLNPLTLGSYAISESVMLDGVPHVTRKAMGEFLEYNSPQRAIGNLIQRNPFIETYSVGLNMSPEKPQSGTLGPKNRIIQVYHPVGFMAVVLSSDQPKAKIVKEAVANLVYEYSRRDKMSVGLELQVRYQKISLIRQLDKVETQFGRNGLLNSLQQVCDKLGEPMPDIGLLGRKVIGNG